ncbi:MAG: hypothetical protein ACLFST_02405 [Spirochaetia bacterium]
MKTAEKFFNWAYQTRANTVMKIFNGEEMSSEKMFLSFTSHNPAMVSNGPAGLNASIKGVGFVPKPDLMQETLDAYIEHIKSYDKEDKEYSKRGLEILVKHLYSPEASERIDFSIITSLELAKKHSWENYKVNPEATLIYYQPPVISYELRGKMEIHEDDIYQRFVNAQHDVYHAPNMERWPERPAYVFRIEEIWDNSVGKEAFGTKMQYPY